MLYMLYLFCQYLIRFSDLPLQWYQIRKVLLNHFEPILWSGSVTQLLKCINVDGRKTHLLFLMWPAPDYKSTNQRTAPNRIRHIFFEMIDVVKKEIKRLRLTAVKLTFIQTGGTMAEIWRKLQLQSHVSSMGSMNDPKKMQQALGTMLKS